jgi:hypothetical protein
LGSAVSENFVWIGTSFLLGSFPLCTIILVGPRVTNIIPSSDKKPPLGWMQFSDTTMASISIAASLKLCATVVAFPTRLSA